MKSLLPAPARPLVRTIRRRVRASLRSRRGAGQAVSAAPAPSTSVVPAAPAAGAPAPAVTPPAPASSAPEQLAVEPLERTLALGLPLPAAVLRTARSYIEAGRTNETVSLGYGLLGTPQTAELGFLVLGVVRNASSSRELAWRDLANVRSASLRAVAADDWFVPAYAADPALASEALQQLRGEGLLAGWDGRQLVRVARAAFVNDDLDATRSLVADGLAREDDAVNSHHRHELRRLASWLPEGARRRPARELEADVRLGVLNYHQPDVSSRNVGDWIQTLASLGHLVRHTNLSYVGEDPELVEVVRSLAEGTRPERRITTTAPATVQLVEVQRDAMPYQDLPAGTWVPTFGWYMHPTFDQGFSFPFPETVRPLFISFHLNKPALLDDAAIAYLRRYAPVGCRDWQTVVALRSVGVPAFFSGCLTTTVDTVVPPGDPQTRGRTGYVDHPREDEGEVIEQTITDLRSRSFAENLTLAREWVGGYATRFDKIFTSRLHCNLPARSVGCEVVFRPKNRSDVRFGGLIDTDDQAFEAIRQGILDKLAAVMELILAGVDEETVYARWREVTAADVAAADDYLGSLEWDLGDAPELPVLHPGADRVVLVELAPGEAPHLEGFLAQLADRVPDGTAVVVVGDETLHSPLDAAQLEERSGLPVAFVNRRTVTLAPLGRAAVKDRRFRHQVLVACALGTVPHAQRLLLLPAAALLRQDLGELFELDLEEQPVAAPLDPRRTRRLGATLARGVSARQGDDAAGALAFLAAAARTVAPRETPFDPVVLVVDPERLRASGYDVLVPLMARYRASFREALNVLLGDRRVALPERWATQPQLQTPAEDAALLVYRVGTRPWSPLVTPGAEEWREAQRTRPADEPAAA